MWLSFPHLTRSCFSRRRRRRLVLALIWQLGLLAGMLPAAELSPDVITMMRRAALCPVSIVGLLAVLFLPLLFSAFAVLINAPLMLFAICFFKAFTTGFCTRVVGLAFGGAGWLVRLLLLFSPVVMAPILLWFWFRQVFGKKETLWLDLLICCALILLIGVVDYRFVGPFLREISVG